MKTNAVLVLKIAKNEAFEMEVQSSETFSEDEQGNKEAEASFTALLKEEGITDTEEIEGCLDDGYYESEDGETKIIIRHT